MNQMMMDDRSPLMLFDVFGGLRTLWHHRLLIIVATLALFSAGVLYVALTKPIYTAEASILVDPRDIRATNVNSVLPGIGADSAAISSQVSVIESRDLLGSVFDSEGLATDPEFADQGLTAKLTSLIKPPRPLSRDAIFNKFQSLVAVEREGLTYVINVSFRSHDPQKAARIVNAIVARYKANLSGETANANDSVSATLSGKIVGLQSAVSDADRAVQDFKASHHIFDATTGGTLQSQIDQLTTQLVAARDQASQAQNKYAQAIAAGTGPQGLAKLSEISSSATTDKLRDDYNTRAAALANAQALYGPRHPTIISLEAELSKLEGLMAREADRIIQELKASRDLAAQNVGNIEANVARLRAEGNQSDLAQVQLRELQSRADAARSVLNDFMRRAQETSQMQGLQVSQVRVISSAVPPTQATWPKPLLLLPVSGLLGLAIGCAAAMALGAPHPRPAPSPSPAPQGAPPTDRHAARPMPQSGAKSRIPGLGTYRLPRSTTTSLRARMRAARLQLATSEDTPFVSAVQHLLSQVIERLGQHEKPYVVLFSSARDGAERKLAAELLGIGLNRISGRPLLVELGSAKEAEATPITLDQATGLYTLVLDAAGPAIGLDMLKQIVAATGLSVDFILVAGHALADAAYDPGFADFVDLEVVVFKPAERLAADWLQEFAATANISRKATLVLDVSNADPATEAGGPRLVFNAGHRRLASTAAG